MKEEKKDNIEIYELGYHLVPDITDSGVASEVAILKNKIESLGGNFISDAFPEQRNLSYDISKRVEGGYKTFSKSYFGWFKFELNKDKIQELHLFVDKMSSIVRFIIVKTVRENTLYYPKMISNKKNLSKTEEGGEKVEMSEEEINKSIDDLVVE